MNWILMAFSKEAPTWANILAWFALLMGASGIIIFPLELRKWLQEKSMEKQNT